MAAINEATIHSSHRVSARPAPVPCIRLSLATLLLDGSDGLIADYQEVETAVIELWFEHRGVRLGARIDGELERRARYLLESFGAVEVTCIEGCELPIGVNADYVIDLDTDIHALCSFGAYALPQLRRMGWRVEVSDDYPVNVVGTDSPWHATVEPLGGAGGDDWFSFELGVDIEGTRVDLLPALLDLVEGSAAASLEGLLKSTRKFVAVPLGERRYLPVPPDRLKTIARVLLELYSGRRAGAALPFRGMNAGALHALDVAFGGDESELVWSAPAGLRNRAFAMAQIAAPEQRPSIDPVGLRATLRPYQEEGLAWLQRLAASGAGGILADDMGLGKTLQTIAHIAVEKAAGRLDRPCLVVAPTSLVGNWKRELRKFAPHLTVLVLHGPERKDQFDLIGVHDVVLTTYAIAVRDLERFRAEPYHLLICDEAQHIKNPSGRTHKALREIEARHNLCLSGTPVENNLGELWALMDFAMPGFLGDRDCFRRTFRIPIERFGDHGRLDMLREQVSPFILRRLKQTVARDLPPKTEIVRPVELSGNQRELYESIRVSAHERVRKAIRDKGFAASTVTILDALMKLRQVCCDPRLVTVPSARKVKQSAKFEVLFELLERQRQHGRRVLVFSQFTSMLALIGEGLRERSIDYLLLTGSTTHRQRHIDAFERGAADVFLISLKAGGTGLNLTSADTVIHYDPWWNPAVQAQATDRAYRIGQQNPVFVYNLIVAGSVEERMMQLQRAKRALADGILHEREPGAGLLDDHELDDLFAPLSS